MNCKQNFYSFDCLSLDKAMSFTGLRDSKININSGENKAHLPHSNDLQ